jgi:hypothetical protein
LRVLIQKNSLLKGLFNETNNGLLGVEGDSFLLFDWVFEPSSLK